MNDPLITRFAEACGATGPLDLRVGLADGGALAEGSVHQPFTLVGRDESCDVTLSDPDVHLRHAWFQVVDGRVFALDLGSRTGLVWPSGECGPGWLDVGESVRIGPFRVHLRSPVSNRQPAHASANSPLQSDPVLARSWPVVHLDFRNGKRAKDRWPVNRAITLIGRSEGCKIHLNADDIAGYHCGLVHTPAGLWVVDLSGRGVVVNGERMRVAPLPHGAELWVGRFLIGCRYLSASDTPGVSRPLTRPQARGTGTELAAATCHEHRSMAGTQVDEPLLHDAEDEVPLGGLPAKDPTSGLPSSHIMCDAFRATGASGAISAPILLSGSIPTPPDVAHPTGTSTAAPSSSTAPDLGPPSNGFGVFGGLEPITEDPLGTVLSQFSDLHAQMLDQIQQSLLAMLTLSGAIREDQVGPLRLELARIQELNVELGKYQAEIIRLALTRVMGGGQPSFLPSVSDETPLPSRTLDGTEAIQDWVQQQMVTLQKERQSRWQKLAGLVDAGDRPRG